MKHLISDLKIDTFVISVHKQMNTLEEHGIKYLGSQLHIEYVWGTHAPFQSMI